MNQLPDTGFLRLQQIIGNAKRGITPIIPVSKTSWWAGVKTGRYPKPVKIGLRTTAWDVADIRRLIENISPGNQPKAGRAKPSAIELSGQA